MKRPASFISMATLLIVSGLSHAGSNISVNIGLGYGNNHNYGHHRYRQSFTHHNRYSNRYIKFGGYGRHYDGNLNIGIGHRYYGNHHNSDYVAGALILGGLIGYGINSLYRHNYDRQYYPHKQYQVPYRNSDLWDHRTGYTARYDSSFPAGPVRRLHRDRDGRCFEIRRNDRGEEFGINLDRSQCNW